MKTLIVAALWVMVGLGVVSGSLKMNNKRVNDVTGNVLFIAVVLWPSVIVADFYPEGEPE